MNALKLIPLVLLLSSALAATGPSISVNGKPHAAGAQVIGGQTFIPLSVLDALGIPYTSAGGKLSIGASGPATAAGGANERPSLAGCRNEWLFNGVWRVRVGKVERIAKDAGTLTETPGWGLSVEVRNGTGATITPTDAGWSGTGEGLQLAFADASTLAVDPYEVQKLTFNSFPQGGAYVGQLRFYAPFGTPAAKLSAPTKLLLELNPKAIGDSTRARGVAFTVPNPSLRVDLTCSK